ncbi:hypothetical protein KI387_035912 [Taxus chinensis]|uniref:RNA helicase n=1 Tax=Taxus chinensis TaxID=29808 RepID=A0AA38KQ03_TAXCH|nr:hypothetical protein KI387_035912 [Taxus chinensis]
MAEHLLFGGLHFNKKRFAADFAKFEAKPKDNDTDILPVQATKAEEEEVKLRKKKKPKFNVFEETSTLFNVFKAPEDSRTIDEEKKEQVQAEKKEHFQKQEVAISLRKKYGIYVAGEDAPSPLEDFDELKCRYGCKSYLTQNLAKFGFSEPTPIQRQAIPVLLSGRECFACAPTGSGKTLAFLIPILMKLKRPSKDGIRAVVLCPSRELAAQTTRECIKLTEGRKFRVKLMTKTLARCADFEKLSVDILVSTPLRLDFVLSEGKLNLSSVEYLILDESDKLFELGFVEQIDSVVNACSSPSVVRSLFSATLPDSVEELARTIMHDPVRILVGRKNSASLLIKQKLLFVGSEEGKLLALRQIFKESWKPPILIFVQSKERAKELYKELLYDEIKVGNIHADLTQAQRESAVEKFREGTTWVLIATDIIARGMDFKGVNCVINYDFPESAAAYIHRIGRCGRAGRAGEAVTLYTEDDVPFLRNIANISFQTEVYLLAITREVSDVNAERIYALAPDFTPKLQSPRPVQMNTPVQKIPN